jgi:triacylglycerol lipase
VLSVGITDVRRALVHDFPRTAFGVALEAGWVTTHLLMYPLGLVASPVARSRRRHDLSGLSPQQRGLVHYAVDAAATPILFVHGIVDNHSIFALMERTLRRRGFCDLSWFDYGLLTSDVRRAAGDLATAIGRLTEESGYERIHVIGHSLGGLIARYYVQRMDGHERVRTLITLGTPHAGTELARAVPGLPLVQQLRPGSDLMSELTEPAPECMTRFLVFSSDLDQLIHPSRNARLEHPDLQVRNVSVSAVGHLSLPNNSAIAFQIAAELSALDPDVASTTVSDPV